MNSKSTFVKTLERCCCCCQTSAFKSRPDGDVITEGPSNWPNNGGAQLETIIGIVQICVNQTFQKCAVDNLLMVNRSD